MRPACIVAATAMMVACSGPKKNTAPPPSAPRPAVDLRLRDAPYLLASDSDLATTRRRFLALDPSSFDRPALRRRLAAEYARRIDRGFADQERHQAFASLVSMLQLWQPGELVPGHPSLRDLLPFAPRIERIRRSFARSGGEIEATTAHAALMLLAPAQAAAHQREIELIFRYADDLSVAQFGDGAQRARPIEILEAVVKAVPSRFVVDQLGKLYVARQRDLTHRFRTRGPDFGLIRAHGNGVLRTTWNIVRILARAGRLAEATQAVKGVYGIGDDLPLRRLLQTALSPDATPDHWVELATQFVADQQRTDLDAALAVARAGIDRFGRSASLMQTAARIASRKGNLSLAIGYYERALKLDPGRRSAAERLAELYQDRINELLDGERPLAAIERLTQLEAYFSHVQSKWPGARIDPDLASAYAAVGRGLVGLGELDRARAYLHKSIELRPTQLAYEFLGTVALKQERFSEAARYLEAALAVPGNSGTHTFNRAKILRLASEAYAGAGMKLRRLQYARAALVAWNQLDEHLEDGPRGEMLVERGKLFWSLGHRRAALVAFDAAIDNSSDDANAHAAVISFLVVRNQYERALDAYHRALGSEKIGEYFKVYMSLWVVAEARRTRRDPDRLALGYLAARRGGLWYDKLARFASGRMDGDSLERAANTRAQHAEMLYYRAVLGDASRDPRVQRRLLERVVATDAVLFFEYDMAKTLLGRTTGPSRRR